MAIVPQLDGFVRSPVRRTTSICMFVFAFLALFATPALASYEWCSCDPVLAFTRQTNLGDVSIPNLLDVQVMVPFQASSMGDVATLTVILPTND